MAEGLSQREREQLQRYLAAPLDFPTEFVSWLEDRMRLLIPKQSTLGDIWVAFEDDSEKTTSPFVTDEEKARAALPVSEWYGVKKLYVRLVGYRRVDTLGGGSDEVNFEYGTRNAGDTGDPSWTNIATFATANETTSTWKDSGWVEVPVTTDDLIVVRYTADCNNTGQTTWTRMTALAKLE